MAAAWRFPEAVQPGQQHPSQMMQQAATATAAQVLSSSAAALAVSSFLSAANLSSLGIGCRSLCRRIHGSEALWTRLWVERDRDRCLMFHEPERCEDTKAMMSSAPPSSKQRTQAEAEAAAAKQAKKQSSASGATRGTSKKRKQRQHPLGGRESSSSSTTTSFSSPPFEFVGSAGYRRAIERALYYDMQCGLKMMVDCFVLMMVDTQMERDVADLARIEADVQLIGVHNSSSSLAQAGHLASPAAVLPSNAGWTALFYRHCKGHGIAGGSSRAELRVRGRLEELRERTRRYRGVVELLLWLLRKCEAIVARLRRIQGSNYGGSKEEFFSVCVGGDGFESSFMAEVASASDVATLLYDTRAGGAGVFWRPMQDCDALQARLKMLWTAQMAIVEPASGAVPTNNPTFWKPFPGGPSVLNRPGTNLKECQGLYGLIDLKMPNDAITERQLEGHLADEKFQGMLAELILGGSKAQLPHIWWPRLT